MLELVLSVVPEFVGGILALMCAVIGAKIATISSERQSKRQDLQRAYAEVFAGYYACMNEKTDENLLRLITAVEASCLICSEQSESIMRESIQVLTKDQVDIAELGNCIKRLREYTKQDIAKQYSR